MVRYNPCCTCEGNCIEILGYKFIVSGNYDQNFELCKIKPKGKYKIKIMYWWDFYIMPFLTIKDLLRVMFKIKKSAMVGVLCYNKKIIPMAVCPFCRTKQRILYELQRCVFCKKKFFIL